MCGLIFCLLVAAGADETANPKTLPEVLTPKEVLTKAKQLIGNGTTERSPICVRFRVESVNTQTVTDSDNRTFEQFILHPASGDTKQSSFHVAIAPTCKKELNRLGIVDLKKHFTGKVVELKGRLDVTPLTLYSSKQLLCYSISVDTLDQIHSVKDAQTE
jgi:hypothetical protein